MAGRSTADGGVLRSDVEAVLWAVARTPARLYGVALIPPALVLLACLAQPWVPLSELLQDPMQLAYGNGTGKTHYGFVSNLGVLLWTIAGAAGLVAAGTGLRSGDLRLAAFFGAAGALSLTLGLDDLLMIHESLWERHVGLSEAVLFAAYGVGALAYGWFFRREIAGLNAGLVAAAFGCFATSLLLDRAFPDIHGSALGLLAEDGAKFMGASAWACFQVDAATRSLRPVAA